MQGIKRRVVYVALFELIAIAVTAYGLSFIYGRDMGTSGLVAIVTSVSAIVWNFVYNYGFEYVESRRGRTGRSLLCRVVHAVGFEIGLAIVVVPMMAYLLKIDLVTAFLTNIGIMLFFMVYAFLFNLGFDKIFGLPFSAQGAAGKAESARK